MQLPRSLPIHEGVAHAAWFSVRYPIRDCASLSLQHLARRDLAPSGNKSSEPYSSPTPRAALPTDDASPLRMRKIHRCNRTQLARQHKTVLSAGIGVYQHPDMTIDGLSRVPRQAFSPDNKMSVFGWGFSPPVTALSKKRALQAGQAIPGPAAEIMVFSQLDRYPILFRFHG